MTVLIPRWGRPPILDSVLPKNMHIVHIDRPLKRSAVIGNLTKKFKDRYDIIVCQVIEPKKHNYIQWNISKDIVLFF